MLHMENTCTKPSEIHSVCTDLHLHPQIEQT